MSVYLIVQARIGSQRLPGKMLLNLCGKPLIERVLSRVRASQLVDHVICAIPDTSENDALGTLVESLGYDCFRGSENDVLDRFYRALTTGNAPIQSDDSVVRICADNPFVDAGEIDRLIQFFNTGAYDFAFNNIPAFNNNYPDGLGAEIVSFVVLQKLWKQTTNAAHREHVTQFIWDNPDDYTIGVVPAPETIAFPDIKLDIDTKEDYFSMCTLYTNLTEAYGDILFSAQQIVDCYRKHKEHK